MNTIPCYEIFEISLTGPMGGSPFTDVQLSAQFRLGSREVPCAGFYDGGGVYRLRFMPDRPGEWSYQTRSNLPSLEGQTGAFQCTAPREGVHGPVRVSGRTHFAYDDGAPYFQVGTTCYAWNHQGEDLETQTLATLSTGPFNKLRMCVFPKHYTYNQNEPELHAFERGPDGAFDFTHFNPAFFQHLEGCIARLGELGIEADLILFHPYDRWGYAAMPLEVDERYLRYLVARLGAYRNVWWSFANEWDLMTKSMDAWDRYFKLVQQLDPVQHLRSVHNCRALYDHGKPWVTHVSYQTISVSPDLSPVGALLRQYGKPVVVDEACPALGRHPPSGNGAPLLGGDRFGRVLRARRDLPAPRGYPLVVQRRAAARAKPGPFGFLPPADGNPRPRRAGSVVRRVGRQFPRRSPRS